MVDIETETLHKTCTYIDKSCILRQYVSKGFCTPVINEVCSGSHERKFWGRIRAQKNLSYCLSLLQTRTIMATVRDSCHYSNNLLQGGLEEDLLHFLYMAVLLAEACAVITNLTLIKGNFWYIISL